MSTFRKGVALVVLIAAVSLVAAVSAFGGPSSTDATTVTVTLGKPSEFKITLSKKTIVKGATTFKVTNKGGVSHDFKIAGKKTVSLKTGKAATLKATLKKGKYPFLCTLPGHAAAGMKGTLTVK
ncbi:MAG TPA: cupredoxin domain-containing protein [Gaiellaceae bacterium]|nr:cupredoxin domain-containing protein [Gaiellaceae bacterium]